MFRNGNKSPSSDISQITLHTAFLSWWFQLITQVILPLGGVKFHTEGLRKRTHVDELDLPDLLHQLHGGVAVDEERLGVVSQLQRLQPLRHRRGVISIVTHRPHLREKDAGQMSCVNKVLPLSF